MEKTTKGAWIIHHTDKLSTIMNPYEFRNIYMAGKCGILLSALSESEQDSDLNKKTVEVIAQASNIDPMQLPTILNQLEKDKLIDQDKKGNVAVIGSTTLGVLNHTTSLFEQLNPLSKENAAIDLAEITSENPKIKKNVSEYISDTYHFSKEETLEFLGQIEDVGFIDSEEIDGDDKLYFNGNLFRIGSADKINKVLSSLSTSDKIKVNEVGALLDVHGCISYATITRILGKELFEKLQSIGFYDVNTVSNDQNTSYFVTKPSAFSKYGNPFTEDALDLAKAFVASLTYGMTQSAIARGKISRLKALLTALISGREVGPATAIGQDYQILEYKRVIKIRKDPNSDWGFFMRLLKKDIGEIALKILNSGNASQEILLKGKAVTNYVKPERNREQLRKKSTQLSTRTNLDILRTMRNEI